MSNSSRHNSSLPTPVWLDVDTGHDDAFAILLAAHHPSVKLLGISTVYGNSSLQHTTYNTRAILAAIGRDSVPVYPGAAKPFCRPATTAPDIHGASGLDGTTCLPIPKPLALTQEVSAVEAMFAALMGCEKGTAWLISTGSLTNVGLLVAVHPEVVDHLGGLSSMGGAIGDGSGRSMGNWTPFAEFNIWLDPESAKAVLENDALAAKTTLVTLDLTHQFLATAEVQSGILHGSQSNGCEKRSPPTRVRQLFFEIVTYFSNTYAEIFGFVDGPPVHDLLAVVAAFAPELLDDGDGERFQITVIAEGERNTSKQTKREVSQCGRTIAEPKADGDAGIRIPRAVDGATVWAMIDACLERATKAVDQSLMTTPA